MRLNAFSPPQYGPSFNAEYPPASTQREGKKIRRQLYVVPKNIRADLEEARRIQYKVKREGYLSYSQIQRQLKIEFEYLPLQGNVRVNGKLYPIPCTQPQLKELKKKIEEMGSKAERQLSALV